MTITQALKEATSVFVYANTSSGLSFAVTKAAVRNSGLLQVPTSVEREGDQVCGYDHDGETLWEYDVPGRRLLIG